MFSRGKVHIGEAAVEEIEMLKRYDILLKKVECYYYPNRQLFTTKFSIKYINSLTDYLMVD